MSQLSTLSIGDFAGFMASADASVPMPSGFYVLRIVPNRELSVEDKLLERGACAWVPKEKRSIRGTWARRSLRTMPIFPGLLFVPDFEIQHGMDMRRLRSIADGIIGFVMFGDRFAFAKTEIMTSIRRIEAWLDVPPRDRPRAYTLGQTVRITSGPFELWEGTVERLDSHGRLRVLLNVLERETPVEMDEGQIEAV